VKKRGEQDWAEMKERERVHRVRYLKHKIRMAELMWRFGYTFVGCDTRRNPRAYRETPPFIKEDVLLSESLAKRKGLGFVRFEGNDRFWTYWERVGLAKFGSVSEGNIYWYETEESLAVLKEDLHDDCFPAWSWRTANSTPPKDTIKFKRPQYKKKAKLSLIASIKQRIVSLAYYFGFGRIKQLFTWKGLSRLWSKRVAGQHRKPRPIKRALKRSNPLPTLKDRLHRLKSRFK